MPLCLITCLALTIERLFRLRYLHRGTHRVRTAKELLLSLRLSLPPPRPSIPVDLPQGTISGICCLSFFDSPSPLAGPGAARNSIP
jgi:hypothetical protein